MANANKESRNFRHATFVLNDGTPTTPESITLFAVEGDLTFSQRIADTRTVLDRGTLWHPSKGDQQAVTGRVSLKFVEFIKQTGDTDETAYEFLTKSGAAAAFAPIDANIEDWNIEMVVTIAAIRATDKDEIITFAKLIPQNVEFSEGDEYNTLSFDFIDWETTAAKTKAA